jgi:predicted permease
MHSLLQDLRFTLRMLRKAPGFTAIAVLSLALGIGANATIFSWVKAAVLDPLPGVPETQRLLTINNSRAGREGLSNSYPQYVYYRDHNNVFSGIAAYELLFVNISGAGEPEMLAGGIVSGNFFDTLHVRPALGRAFAADEDQPGSPRDVVVLSDSLWKRRYAGDPTIVGKTIYLNRRAFTVIGVAPARFMGTYGGLGQNLWVPMATQPELTPGGNLLNGSHWIQIIGRLKPGVTQAAAQANLHLLSRQLGETDANEKNLDAIVYDLAHAQRGIESSMAQILPILMVAVGLVLLVACANVANLLLGRATARRREIAIRSALGARSSRLFRQLLVEGLLLSAMGAALGVLFSVWTGDLLPALMPPLDIPLSLDFGVDWRVMLFGAGLGLLTGVFFGIVPALQARRTEIVDTLKDTAASTTAGAKKARLRAVLVGAQVCLSLIALVAAGLFVRTMRKSLTAHPGFDSHNVLLASLQLYPNGYDAARARAFYRDLLQRAQALPGVQSASLASFVPLGTGGGGNSVNVSIAGYTPRPDEEMSIVTDYTGPNYLRTLRIPLVSGRDFTDQDREDSPQVVVVNETMARRYWPGQDAIGKRITVAKKEREVIGVARDIRYRFLGESPQAKMYLPAFQSDQDALTIVLRTAGDPYQLAAPLSGAIHAMDGALPVIGLQSLDKRVSDSLFASRAMAALLSGFGLLALVLAAIGLYGLMAFFVAGRTHEIGIRMALGAARTDIVGMILRQAALMVVPAVLVGIAASLAVNRVIAGMLYGISPSDPLTFIFTAALLAAVAAVAGVVPARRAMRVDPMQALRHQ